MITGRPGQGPSRADILLVVTTALFTAAGLGMVAGEGRSRREGIGVLAFFGLCCVIAVWIIRRKVVIRRNLAARSVTIVGSVPIRVRVGRFVALLSAVGAVMLVIGWASAGSAAGVISVATGVVCFALIPVVIFGPPGKRAIVFEPEGLRMLEPTFSVLVPWGELASARLIAVEETPIIALTFHDPARLVPCAAGDRTASPQAARRFARLVARNRYWLGCDLCIGPSALGLDAALLVRAIETYVRDPEARHGLARKALGGR